MPKERLELRNFIEGTNSSASASDVGNESPVFSKNIESLDEEGKLKGIKTNVPLRSGDTPNQYKVYLGHDIVLNTTLVYSATIFEDTVTKDCGAIDGNATAFTQKLLRKSFASNLQANKYIEKAELKSGYYSSNTGFTSGTYIDTGEDLPANLTTDATAIVFSTGSPSPSYFTVGEVLKIGNEEIYLSSITDPENTAGYTLNVERGYNGTTATTHTSGDAIKAIDNWNIIEITYVPQVESPANIKYSVTIGGSKSTLQIFDDTSYFEINGRNFSLLDRKDENSTIVTTDVAFYNKDTSVNPPEYKMKVIQDFYQENGPRNIVEPVNGGYVNSSNSGYPESVTLAKGPNAVYIGTGSTTTSKAQWLGRINHSQFGAQIDGYHLEDSKVKAIDDGSAIFSLSYMDLPHSGSSSNRESLKFAVAISNDKRHLYGLNFRHTSNQQNDSVGKQHKTESVGEIITAVGSSRHIHEHMKNNYTGNAKPIIDTWNGSNDASTFAGHDADYATYVLVGKANKPNVIGVIGLYYHYNSNDEPEAFLHKDFGEIELTHHLKIDSKLAQISALNDGDLINRPPKGGSYINDIYEKNGQVYIQYGHNSGFSFDEEYLYTFDIDTVLSQTSSLLDQITVNATPITPPVLKLKNFGNDYRNAGHDWYASEECCDFSGLASESWIGQSIPWGNYANYIKWRNIDILGFTKDGKHGLYPREISTDNGATWETVEPDTGNWNKNYAESTGGLFSGGDDQHTPGYTRYGVYGNQRNNNNPKIEIKNVWDSALIAATHGFETVAIQTITGGIVNLQGDDNSDGEIGCQVFVDGKRIDSNIRVHKKKSDYQSWLTYKRRHYYYNKTEPVIKNVSEMMVFSTDRQTYGVSQRCVPYEYDSGWNHSSHHKVSEDDTSTGEYTQTDLKTGDGFQNINGATSSGWGSDWETETIQWDGSTTVKKPMKYAWRYGCYSSGRGTNASTYSSDRQFAMYNNLMVELATLSSASTDTNTSITLRPGDINDRLRGPGKNYSNTDYFVTSAITDEMVPTDTYISRWSTVYGNQGNSKITYTGVNTVNPMKVKGLGSASIQDKDNNGQYFMVPTTTTTSSGLADLYQAQNTWSTASAGDGYLVDNTYGTYYFKANAGELGFGLIPEYAEQVTEIISSNPTVYAAAPFMAGTKYYYKLSMLYDGFQEGPLSNFEFTLDPDPIYNHKTVTISIEMNVPPKRVSDIVLYRKANANEYYKMVQEVSLASGWAYDSNKDVYKKTIIDEGNAGATYEAINGVSELISDTSINYKLSTVAQGHLVVADCYHKDLKQGQNFILKSEPDAFSVFNWPKNFAILPTKPTALTWFSGKVYAFDLNNMYRISLDNLVLEDTFEGVGCISQDSFVVTDMGLFFCDYQGLYWHNGQRAENIGMPILTSSQATDETDIINVNALTDPEFQQHAWQNINHNIPPKVLYDPRTLTVYYCFQDKHAEDSDFPAYNGAWKFNLSRKRLDLVDINEPVGVFSGNRNDSYISGESKLFEIGKGVERSKWSWKSKKFDFNAASQDKTFYAVHIKCNNVEDATNLYTGIKEMSNSNYGTYSIYVNENNNAASTSISREDSTLKIKLKGPSKTASFIQIYLANMLVEVDAISIIYRPRRVKT